MHGITKQAISEGNELKPGPRIQMKMRDRSMEAAKSLEPDDTFSLFLPSRGVMKEGLGGGVGVIYMYCAYTHSAYEFIQVGEPPYVGPCAHNNQQTEH
jgi:hypothetical protein